MSFLSSLLTDLAHAWRGLGARRGYALAAIVTLALGLGATTAVFSAVYGYLLRPLPFPDSGRLVNVYAKIPQFGEMKLGISAPDYLDVRDRSRTLSAIGIYASGRVRLGEGAGSARVAIARVTPGLLPALGVVPAFGRGFADDDGLPGRDAVALLTHAAWVERYASDPDIAGRRVRVDGREVEVVGVMPPGFAFPDRETELLVPMPVDPAARGGNLRGNWNGTAVARLAPGASVAAAQTELRALWKQFVTENPEMAFFVDNLGYRIEVQSLRDSEVAALRPTLRLLQLASLLVLLVAAANLAGLTLSRVAQRVRELAVRSALGAGTSRLLGSIVIENLLLAAIGGGAGIALAAATLHAIQVRGLGPDTQLVALAPDATVFAAGMALALLTGLATSFAPLLWLRRAALDGVLRGEARGATGGRGAQRFRAALVIGQVALSLTLAVLVGLLALSMQRLLAVDPGFVSDGVLVGQVAPRDEDAVDRTGLDLDAALEAAVALPGAGAAGIASCMPFAGCASMSSFRIAGADYGKDAKEPTAHNALVSVNFFDVLRIPLKAGRGFEPADLAGPGAVIVDEAFAARWFPGRSPLGQVLVQDRGEIRAEFRPVIVGVVGNVLAQDLSMSQAEPTYYTLGDAFADDAYLVARLPVAAGAADLLRDAVQRTAPGTTLRSIAWLRERLHESVSSRIAPMLLIAAFALLAVVLAALGVYSVLALSVARRTAEFGVRAALGADRMVLLRQVLGQGARLLGAGVALGGLLAFASSALIASTLFGVARAEPVVYVAAIAVLVAIGLAACWLPAWRAARIDPTVALRHE